MPAAVDLAHEPDPGIIDLHRDGGDAAVPRGLDIPGEPGRERAMGG